MNAMVQGLIGMDEGRLRARIGEGEHNLVTLAGEFGCCPAQVAPFIEIVDLQKKLQRDERRFQMLVNERLLLIHNCDAELENPRVIYAASGLLGPIPDPFTWDWWIKNMVHPDDRQKFITELAAGRASQRFHEKHYRILADGRWRHIISQTTPMSDDNGHIEEWISTLVDVTVEKEAEEKLQRSERRYRALVNMRAQIVWRANARGVVTELLSADTNLIGPDFTAPSLEHWLGRVHPEDRDKFFNKWKSAVIAQTESRNEYRIRRENGGWAHIVSQATPLRDAGGAVEEWIGTVIDVTADVTEHRLLEEQLRQAQKMEAVGQLAGGVAHDFNNLLTVIIGCNELLHKYVPDDEHALELMAEIKRASQRATGLTQQLLAFSRKAVIAPRVLNLNDVVREIAKMLRRLIGEDVALETKLAAELSFVHADRGQLEQVLMNLAVNSRDAMPTGGRLTIETGTVPLDEIYTRTHPNVRPGNYVLLAVTDTGCGMSREVQARIFEPFFTTKEQGKGTGLGLATVYGIVQQAGGHMAVHSEVGRGTCFKIYLPGVEAKQPSADVSSTRQPVVGGHETILLVEDEASVRAYARRVLQLGGYTVLEAGNGLEALQKVTAHAGQIDLLLTDVVMPGFSGRELAERLAKIYPAMKVLFVSGYTNDAVVRHGIQQAEMQFLEKPFDLDALKQKVREVLDLHHAAKNGSAEK
jgi:two-component system, cell cycle sensor histidine kinase and response regulator CckA